jgi:hypothetical protein
MSAESNNDNEQERKNVILGLQPNFSINVMNDDEEDDSSRARKNSRLHDYNPNKKRKRVLKRVRRDVNGSASSYSSIESDWISVVEGKNCSILFLYFDKEM